LGESQQDERVSKVAKIIQLFNEQTQAQQRLVKHIEDLLEAAKRGDITNVMVAARHKDGSVVTGYCNLDIGERQFLCSHIQTDITFEVARINADRLIYGE
jgi:GTP cyclohydrolase I